MAFETKYNSKFYAASFGWDIPDDLKEKQDEWRQRQEKDPIQRESWMDEFDTRLNEVVEFVDGILERMKIPRRLLYDYEDGGYFYLHTHHEMEEVRKRIVENVDGGPLGIYLADLNEVSREMKMSPASYTLVDLFSLPVVSNYFYCHDFSFDQSDDGTVLYAVLKNETESSRAESDAVAKMSIRIQSLDPSKRHEFARSFEGKKIQIEIRGYHDDGLRYR